MVHLHQTLQLSTSTKQTYISLPFVAALAWENSWYFVMPALVSLRNYVLWTTERLQKFQTDDIHYPDLGNSSDWLKQVPPVQRPIRSTTLIWAVIRHGPVSHTSFREETRPVVEFRNVGCFLRLPSLCSFFSVVGSDQWLPVCLCSRIYRS